jgi:hypothetical protein
MPVQAGIRWSFYTTYSVSSRMGPRKFSKQAEKFFFALIFDNDKDKKIKNE